LLAILPDYNVSRAKDRPMDVHDSLQYDEKMNMWAPKMKRVRNLT
jgi:hypothetical protein